MKISDLEFYLVAVPRSDVPDKVRSVLVRLASDTGHEGWGEAHLDWRPAELEARRDALLPLLSGRSVYDVEELVELDALRPVGLMAALEIASWDMIGQAAGQPLCHLLGGVYRNRIPLAVRLPTGELDGQALRARELSDRGFHVQILTLTADPASDLLRVSSLAEATAERVEFRLDAQGAYTLEAARDFCGDLERCDVVRYLLDPVARGEPEATATLRRQTSVPLGLQMAIRGSSDVLQVGRSAAASKVVLSLHQIGGVGPLRKCAAVAEAAGLSTSLAARSSVGIAVAAMLHVAGATANIASANEVSYHNLSDDVLADRLEIVDGMMVVPEAPGLGIEINRRKLEKYQVT